MDNSVNVDRSKLRLYIRHSLTELIANVSSPTLSSECFQLIWPRLPLPILSSLQVVKQTSSGGEVCHRCLLLVGVCFVRVYEMEVAGLVRQLLKAEVEAGL